MRRWKIILLTCFIFSCVYLCKRYGSEVLDKTGFSLQKVIVRGRNRSGVKEILENLGIKQGDSIWMRSPYEIQKQIQSLPWVKDAFVQRRLPSMLSIFLLEKKPLAVWQNKGQKQIIDDDGKVIAGISSDLFKELILITGEDAPSHFADLFTLLPKILPLTAIKAASFLRSQRWNLYTDKGCIIKLPETHLDIALQRLISLWSTLKSYSSIDLRFSDAIILDNNNK